jgi:long-chain acyl-CoA synthetase
MTSFKAMLKTTQGIVKLLKATDKDRYLSYLPMAHGMERWTGEVSCCFLFFILSKFFNDKILTDDDSSHFISSFTFVSIPILS